MKGGTSDSAFCELERLERLGGQLCVKPDYPAIVRADDHVFTAWVVIHGGDPLDRRGELLDELLFQ